MEGPHKAPVGAFTLIEILAVIAVLVLMAAVLLPGMRRARVNSSKTYCSNNLKQIALSFRVWAMDNNNRYPMAVSATNGGTLELVAGGKAFPHFLVMSNELSTPKILICPEERDLARLTATTFHSVVPPGSGGVAFTNDNSVSYFVGVEADPLYPAMLLSGDSHIGIGGVQANPGLFRLWTNSLVTWMKSRHGGGGNICFGDGSVQAVVNRDWRPVLSKTGQATNCLAIP